MSPKIFRYVIGGCTGVLLAVCIYWWIVYPRYFSPLAKQARLSGSDPITFAEVHDFQERAQKTKRLTSRDLDRLSILANDKSTTIQIRALSALFYSADTDQADKASSIARTKLADSSGLVRQYALSALYRLKAPDTLMQAQQMRTDSQAGVRAKAEVIIKKLAPANPNK